MEITESKQFRENIRMLERCLEMVNRSQDSCCQSITLPQCHALVEIGRKEKVTLKELAQIIMLDTSTTSRTVDTLVRKNLAKRAVSLEDRRSIAITLTKEGQRVFCEIEQSMDEKFKSIFDRIPKDQKANVLNALNAIIDAFHGV